MAIDGLRIEAGRGSYVARRHSEDGPYEVLVDYYFIGADSARGDRWVYEPFSSEDEAEVNAKLVEVLASGSTPETDPASWAPTDPCYGSEAWGPENEYELACFEADCYGEPRPQW